MTHNQVPVSIAIYWPSAIRYQLVLLYNASPCNAQLIQLDNFSFLRLLIWWVTHSILGLVIIGNWRLVIKNEDKFHAWKGLCEDSKVDTDYLLLGYETMEPKHKRSYGGSTGWLLSHYKEEDMWQLNHPYYPHLTLTMEEKDSLPVGIHSWLAGNNTCNLGKTSRFSKKKIDLYQIC